MNRISNYEELLAERRRIEMIIADRKETLHERVNSIKEKIAPLVSVLSIFNGKKSEGDGKSSLLKVGSSVAIDLLVGQKLLKSASWFTKLVVPSLLKMVSSKVIDRTSKA
jgi:hypothetical protein